MKQQTELFEDKKILFNLKAPESLIEGVKILAAEKGMSASAFTRYLWIREIELNERKR